MASPIAEPAGWDARDLPPRKDEAECCVARRDSIGRLPIGFCSPTCIRRQARDATLAANRTRRTP